MHPHPESELQQVLSRAFCILDLQVNKIQSSSGSLSQLFLRGCFFLVEKYGFMYFIIAFIQFINICTFNIIQYHKFLSYNSSFGNMRDMMNRLSTRIKKNQPASTETNLFMDMRQSTASNPFNLNNNNYNIQSSEVSNGGFFKMPPLQDLNLSSENFANTSGPILLPKISKSDSKMQSSAQQSSIRKQKQILTLIYNKNYVLNYNKDLEQIIGNQNSQQLRKLRFKGYRLKFMAKEKVGKEDGEKQNYEQYLMRFIESHKIYLYEMNNTNIKLMKPISLTLKQEMSESIQYDSGSSRLFCFSNLTQEVVVFSVKMKQLICRVKIKHKRTNPQLLLHNYKGKQFLLIIGGYEKKGSMVEGSKFIEVFLIDKWEISLHQKTIRLSIGRIYPIVFTYDLNQEPSIYIIGGNSNGRISARKKDLNFDRNEDINFSTNQTGVKLLSSFIYNGFFSEEDNFFILNKLDIRFEDPLELYNGCVLVRRQNNGNERLQLFLSNRSQILDLKIINSEISIIESKFMMDYKSKNRLGLKIGYYRNEENTELVRLDKKGELKLVQLISNENKKESNQINCALM